MNAEIFLIVGMIALLSFPAFLWANGFGLFGNKVGTMHGSFLVATCLSFAILLGGTLIALLM